MTLMARWSGVCPECGGRWAPGDVICGNDNHLPYEQRTRPTVWRHVVCPDDDPLEATNPVCQECWLTHPPIEGACDR